MTVDSLLGAYLRENSPEGSQSMLRYALTREENLGLEGAAARAYFQLWRALLDTVLGSPPAASAYLS
ncbi:hypothetical protein AB0F52_38575 [Amycolatopsis sp. NPDC024027]|uniref:hypothetical protein n=1 Tax=Amycolatopsis sp. NPDC024027 TaxID=3154327 RepID=UPI0033E7D169